MNTDPKVLVVARDRGLRNSYAFLLEAEGFQVNLHDDVSSAVGAARDPLTVSVLLDESALLDQPSSPETLCRLGPFVILLVSGLRKVAPDGLVPAEVLTKPQHANQLADCIRRLRQQPAKVSISWSSITATSDE